MSVGPHVFGDGRLGCWFTAVERDGAFVPGEFSGKLRDRLPRVKRLGVTDAFLPREASLSDKALVLEAGLYPALYERPPEGMLAALYAERTLLDAGRLGLSVAELNIEGVPDEKLEAFVRTAVARVRRSKPFLRLRINVVAYKGVFLPDDLFASDPQLYLIVQNYLGNMDARVPEDEIVRDLVENGIPAAKVSVMYGAHIAPGIGRPRVPALPEIRFRGSIYQDDLLADGGYLG